MTIKTLKRSNKGIQDHIKAEVLGPPYGKNAMGLTTAAETTSVEIDDKQLFVNYFRYRVMQDVVLVVVSTKVIKTAVKIIKTANKAPKSLMNFLVVHKDGHYFEFSRHLNKQSMIVVKARPGQIGTAGNLISGVSEPKKGDFEKVLLPKKQRKEIIKFVLDEIYKKQKAH